MNLKIVSPPSFSPGDLVTVNSMSKQERFCVIKIKKENEQEQVAVLKALFNDTFIIEKPVHELQSLLIKGIL